MQDELPSLSSEEYVVNERYHFMSLLLNLVNTFLYMVNTYIFVPTVDDYSLSLGAATTVCGVVIGSMAVAQVFSSVYFSAWSNKSYIKPLIFNSIVLLLGNTLYTLAYDLNSVYVLVGRLFYGLESARAVNMRYYSDCVPQKLRMKASAGKRNDSGIGLLLCSLVRGDPSHKSSCRIYGSNSSDVQLFSSCRSMVKTLEKYHNCIFGSLKATQPENKSQECLSSHIDLFPLYGTWKG
ncbi:hypothetical protein L1987_48525 [Smallanthus sonchifolius]|uniref:Uncharacterized protein n=1 Tax=Smallanthus sonchifolius TaxID=185202 RepID=A0ACB9FS75_9ASTR|nr:hypothetical protein L1987_48525 [Smallanthus sonchifolius]